MQMRSVGFMRSLMLTRRFEFLGLVPELSENGDLVCIILGCSVPIVLLEMERDDGGTHVEFIGGVLCSWLDGWAAFKVEKENDLERQMFELR